MPVGAAGATPARLESSSEALGSGGAAGSRSASALTPPRPPPHFEHQNFIIASLSIAAPGAVALKGPRPAPSVAGPAPPNNSMGSSP